MGYLDVPLVKHVGRLLAQDAATHPDFFVALVEELKIHGYNLQAHQRGINGTYLVLVKEEN